MDQSAPGLEKRAPSSSRHADSPSEHGQARGRDLLLIVPDDTPPERRRSRLAYEVLRGTGVAAGVLVCTRAWFDRHEGLETSLPATVLREGRLLHAA